MEDIPVWNRLFSVWTVWIQRNYTEATIPRSLLIQVSFFNRVMLSNRLRRMLSHAVSLWTLLLSSESCDEFSCISSQAVLQVLHMKAARLYLYYQHIYCSLIYVDTIVNQRHMCLHTYVGWHDSVVISSAFNRLIAINRIPNFFIYKIYVCTVYIYYVHINTHAYSIYFDDIYLYLHVYIYNHIFYLINKYI